MSDGDKQIIEHHESRHGGPLGRNLWHDPRNREWAVRPLLATDRHPIRRPWWTRDVFDQVGPSCTAQSAAGVIYTSPFRLKLDRGNLSRWDTDDERHALYLEAQHHDPWEGTGYDGSSTDAPFKVLRNLGAIQAWRWCFGLQDVLDTLRYHGPVSIGTWWYEGMDRPNRHGFITATGSRRGGHAYRLVFDDVDERCVTLVNSWSRSWAVQGRARMSYETLERLLGEDGEACTVTL